MKGFVLKRHCKPSLWFDGEKLGFVSSADFEGGGASGRWTELTLYKTDTGRYVCYMVGCSSWPNERDIITDFSCDTVEEVIGFFGHRWLAKELYSIADIEDVFDIE